MSDSRKANGNDFARRIEKLESAFSLLVNLLDERTARILIGAHTSALDRLLSLHCQGTLDAIKTQRLCQQLRRVEGDREKPREVRFAATLLLIGIELKHMIKSK